MRQRGHGPHLPDLPEADLSRICYRLVTRLRVRGGGEIGLYEPRHQTMVS